PSDMVLSRIGNDLIATIAESAPGAGDGGSVRMVATGDDYSDQGIDQMAFGDGTVWTRADMRAHWLATVSTSGNDTINGFNANDTIQAGAGNDTISGGGGNDTYIWARGDGNDTITETTNGGSADQLVLQGLSASSVSIVRSGNDLIVNVSESTPGAGDGG